MERLTKVNVFVRIEAIKSVSKPDACWLWPGSLSLGYGQAGWMDNGVKRHGHVHRIAYERWVGNVPDGLHLDHLCRERRCFNPKHLEPVTPRINYLRGTGMSARHARKTHCPAGHPFTDENLTSEENCRRCRICLNDKRRRKYHARSPEEKKRRRYGN